VLLSRRSFYSSKDLDGLPKPQVSQVFYDYQKAEPKTSLVVLIFSTVQLYTAPLLQKVHGDV